MNAGLSTLRALAQGLGEFLMPSQGTCLGCGDRRGAQQGWLCDKCAGSLTPLRALEGGRCLRCGRPGLPNTRGGHCPVCGNWPAGAPEFARCAYPYGIPISGLIKNLKYGGVYRLGPWMGEKLADVFIAERFPAPDCLVPVPMHRQRVLERGFNHALVLAQALGAELKKPGLGVCLTRVRATPQQALQKGADRHLNLQGAFAASRAEAAGRHILLVDDVLTSGETAMRCALALREAGARRVDFIALAQAVETPPPAADR